MEKKYEILASALAVFKEDFFENVTDEDSIERVRNFYSNNFLRKNELVIEYQKIIENKDFDWFVFAKESKLLNNSELYLSEEIKVYVQLLFEVIFPEKEKRDYLKLNEAITKFLKVYENDNGWIKAYDLYSLLKLQMDFSSISFLDLHKALKTNLNISRKDYNGRLWIVDVFLKYRII